MRNRLRDARHLPRRNVERLQFWLERWFLRGASYQLLAVAALIGLISLLGGALVWPVESGHLGESVWWAFLRLSDPGYLGDDIGVWRRIVSTLLTVAGYVVFLGALVAIMTTSLNNWIRRLESGLTPVKARNHIVILGWTSRTVPVVRELVLSEGRVRRFLAGLHANRLLLVIQCADVTARHAQALRDEGAVGRRARNIWLRTGSPLAVDDLERIDCGNAAAVIVPGGAPGPTLSSDVAAVKALLSLASMPRRPGAQLPYVVAEVHDQANLPVLQSAYPGPLEAIAGNSLIGRMMAQNLRHQGLSRVYGELLSHGQGCGIYVRQVPEVDGLTYAQASGRFGRAVLCGAVRWHQDRFVPYLNPPADFPLSGGDQLVFITPGYEDVSLDRRDPPAALAAENPQAPQAPDTGSAAVRRILVLGWSSRVISLLHELPSYRGQQFQVMVVSMVSADDRMRFGPQGAANVSTEHIQADYADERTLRGLQPWTFDNVLLASSERLVSGEEADSRALMGHLLLDSLRDAAADSAASGAAVSGASPRMPQILVELQDPNNEPLIRGRRAEVLVSPQIIAHIVAQTALRRELRAIFDALLSAGGTDVALMPVSRYGFDPAATEWQFGALCARVREHGDTLLGWLSGANGELRLNPARDQALRLQAADRLVVLTDA